MKHIYIIGAGGVGSWLAPSVCMLTSPKDVTVIDGDKLEKKNLNRQLFTAADIGKSKADALAAKYGCGGIGEWYSHGKVDLDDTDWLLVAVDNNPARKAALDSCDAFGCRAIVGANEVTSAESYYYQPDWKGSPLDPRVFYPEIATDSANDPRRASIGCTGEAQEKNRQLVTANFMAAALMQHLLVIWHIEYPKLDSSLLPHLPHKLVQNLTSSSTHKVKGE